MKSIFNSGNNNSAPTSLGDLSNVKITAPSNDQVLTYENGIWENRTSISSPVQSVFTRTGNVVATTGDYNINQITGTSILASSANVSIISPQDRQTLTYNSSTSQWQNTTPNKYYDTVYYTSPTLTAAPNTAYAIQVPCTVTINPSAVGDHYLIEAGPNTVIVNFGGTSFILNSYLAGGTPNPTLILLGTVLELKCILNSGQTYYNMIRVQNATNSIFTINGKKVSALNTINNIPDVNITTPTNNQILKYNSSTTAWENSSLAGTVSSVALTTPSEFTVTGSPITSSGTLAITKTNQTQNLIYASPNGSTGVPTFRSLVSADIPALNYVTSFNTRTGAITPISGDYNISQITNSTTLASTATTTITSPQQDQGLIYDGVWKNITYSLGYKNFAYSPGTITAALGTFIVNGTTNTITVPTCTLQDAGKGILIVSSQGIQTSITFPAGITLVYEGGYSNFTMNSPENGCIEFLVVALNQYTIGRCSGNWFSSVLGGKSFNSTFAKMSTLQDTNISGATSGQVLTYNGTQWVALTPTTGTVTSVTLTTPSEFTVTGPITSSGTLAITKTNQAQNLVYASPNGSTGVPIFRSLVSADLPAIVTSFNTRTGAITPTSGDYNINQITNSSILASTVNVNIATPVTNQVVRYNGSQWTNQNPSIQVYTSAGIVANTKIWMGTATTIAGGTYSVAITSAGFSTVTNVQATAQLAGSTSNTAPIATVQILSVSSVTGIVVQSNTVLIGGQGLTGVGAGIVVNITVTGT